MENALRTLEDIPLKGLDLKLEKVHYLTTIQVLLLILGF